MNNDTATLFLLIDRQKEIEGLRARVADLEQENTALRESASKDESALEVERLRGQLDDLHRENAGLRGRIATGVNLH